MTMAWATKMVVVMEGFMVLYSAENQKGAIAIDFVQCVPIKRKPVLISEIS